MPLARPLHPRRSHRLYTIFAMLAMMAQLVVALAPLGEGRIARAPHAHVEAGGTTGHAAHNEATCPSCQARSIQGTTARPTFVLPHPARAMTLAVSDPVAPPFSAFHRQSNPRAPPVVI